LTNSKCRIARLAVSEVEDSSRTPNIRHRLTPQISGTIPDMMKLSRNSKSKTSLKFLRNLIRISIIVLRMIALITKVPRLTIITMTLNLIRTTTNNHIINIQSISTIIISTGTIRVIQTIKDINLVEERSMEIWATADSQATTACLKEIIEAKAGGTETTVVVAITLAEVTIITMIITPRGLKPLNTHLTIY
jgi:hypothetical protein